MARPRLHIAVVAVLALAVLAQPVAGQLEAGNRFCDFAGLRIHIENPDLRIPFDDGRVEVTGTFMGQARIVGDNPDRVDSIAFHFSAAVNLADGAPGQYAGGDNLCDIPDSELLQGPLQYYREDTDPSDGFFINYQTFNIPDGDYFAVLSAYDADGEELTRSWSFAEVNNCSPGTLFQCQDDPLQEIIAPWPRVLPGDGEAPADAALTIEVLEEIAELDVYVNGINIAPELMPWEGVLWDTDLIPQRSPAGGVPAWSEPCTGPGRSCEHLGVAYQWGGPALQDGDVINVFVTDLAGNVAVKTRVVGQDATGVAGVEGALVIWQVDTLQHDVEAGSSVDFGFNLTNFGQDAAFLFPSATSGLPEGWTVAWTPNKLAVQPEAEAPARATITVPETSANGTQSITLRMSYEGAGGTTKLVEQVVQVNVSGGMDPVPVVPVDPCANGGCPAEDEVNTPFIGVAPLLLLLAALAARRP